MGNRRIKLFEDFTKQIPISIKMGSKGIKVTEIQKYLKSLGYNLGVTGLNKDGIDGDFGNATKIAVSEYQRKKSMPVTGEVDQFLLKMLKSDFDKISNVVKTNNVKQSGTLGTADVVTSAEDIEKKGGGFFSRVSGRIKKSIDSTVDFFTVPIHIRFFSYFLGLRKPPVTEKDLTDKEINAIKEMITYAKNKKILVLSRTKTTNFYDIANRMNKDKEIIDFRNKKNLGLNQFHLKSDYTKISLAIGNAYVTKKSGGTYIVWDLYDFNNYYDHPEEYTLASVPKTVGSSFKKLFSGNLVQGIEKLASYLIKMGYKGFVVKVEIKM
jgi:peptidoglycan hydrolase-like protein with peptidoglycan-binding domain